MSINKITDRSYPNIEQRYRYDPQRKQKESQQMRRIAERGWDGVAQKLLPREQELEQKPSEVQVEKYLKSPESSAPQPHKYGRRKEIQRLIESLTVKLPFRDPVDKAPKDALDLLFAPLKPKPAELLRSAVEDAVDALEKMRNLDKVPQTDRTKAKNRVREILKEASQPPKVSRGCRAARFSRRVVHDKAFGNGALRHAVLHNDRELVKLLVEYPIIDPSLPDADGMTPLEYAMIEGHADIVDQLLLCSLFAKNLDSTQQNDVLERYIALIEQRDKVEIEASLLCHPINLLSKLLGILKIEQGVKLLACDVPIVKNIQSEQVRIDDKKVTIYRLLECLGQFYCQKQKAGQIDEHMKKGLLKILSICLAQSDFNFGQTIGWGKTLLHYLIEINWVDGLAQVLKHPNVHLEAKTIMCQNTPLQFAQKLGHQEAIRLLENALKSRCADQIEPTFLDQGEKRNAIF